MWTLCTVARYNLKVVVHNGVMAPRQLLPDVCLRIRGFVPPHPRQTCRERLCVDQFPLPATKVCTVFTQPLTQLESLALILFQLAFLTKEII